MGDLSYGSEVTSNHSSLLLTDESSTDVAATFSCEECGNRFATRQELKEHTQVH